MTAVRSTAERRRRDRWSAWFAVAVALFYGVVETVTKGFDFGYVLALMYAVAWLWTEYQREWDAQP